MNSGSLPQSNGRWPSALALVGAVILAAGLFLIIPLTQALNHGEPDKVTYRQMVLATPPPPPKMPPPPEELKKFEEQVEPEPPRLEQEVMDVPIQTLALDLQPGRGVAMNMGIPTVPTVAKVDTVAEIEKIFNFDELAQPPSVINANLIQMEYPRELTRKRIKQVKVELEILIDKSGRVRVERFISSSYEHPKIKPAAIRVAEKFRFTITRIDGRAVAVRGRLPLTLQSP